MSSTKTTTQSTVLAFLGLVLLWVSSGFRQNNEITADTFVLVIGLALALGLLSMLCYLEVTFPEASTYASLRLGLAAGVAVLVYLARINAINDVNAIFHIDASALPLTTITGVALEFMRLMRLVLWSALGFSVIALAGLWLNRHTNDPERQLGHFVRAFMSLLTSALALLFIHMQLTDAGIASKLYRMAHKSDFSSSFYCANIDPKLHDVLFLGAEQRRVLVAPKIEMKSSIGRTVMQPELLQPLEIPVSFPVVDCVPKLVTQ